MWMDSLVPPHSKCLNVQKYLLQSQYCNKHSKQVTNDEKKVMKQAPVIFYVPADWHRVMSECSGGQLPLVESLMSCETKRLTGSRLCGGTSSASMCLLGHHLRENPVSLDVAIIICSRSRICLICQDSSATGGIRRNLVRGESEDPILS